MIEVVKDLKKHNIMQCEYCRKYIKFDKEDIKGDYDFGAFGTTHWKYIECPNCKNDIQW